MNFATTITRHDYLSPPNITILAKVNELANQIISEDWLVQLGNVSSLVINLAMFQILFFVLFYCTTCKF